MTEGFSARAIARKTLSASMFQIGAQAVTLITGLVRTIILARILAPEDFGLVVFALLLSDTAWGVTAMGIDARLVQKGRMDPDQVATHLTLRVFLSILTFLLLLAVAPFFDRFFPDSRRLGQIVAALAGINILKAFNQTPLMLLRRNLSFRRLALIGVAASMVMLIAASLMAMAGWGLWSLVIGESLAGVLVSTAGLWMFRRPVRFSLKVNPAHARDLVGFGWRVMLHHQLATLPGRFADFWIGLFLGKTALGFYSKAGEFAGYPRRVISRPLHDVLFSTYARLQHDRLNLSRAFFRANSYIIRAGFLIGPLLALIFPELVQYLLGEKWRPMIPVFHILIVYGVLDPLLNTGGNLFIAAGAPGVLNRIRTLQIVFFIPAAILGARWGSLPGVALAADAMMLVGLACFFRAARRLVDFSILRLLGPPILGCIAGLTAVLLLHTLVSGIHPLIWAGGKVAAYAVGYVLVLLILEHAEYREAIREALKLLNERPEK